ncbi:MAG: hypothetical protein JO211_13575 [Acidobacteriaceae bacterium]|nr:hypothetical protein [Acidobacteriaceae bacterium]
MREHIRGSNNGIGTVPTAIGTIGHTSNDECGWIKVLQLLGCVLLLGA